MNDINFGDKLNRIIKYSRNLFFDQGEIAQLTFLAFQHAATQVQNNENEIIEIDIPIGYQPNKRPLLTTNEFKKDELLKKYNFLANNQLFNKWDLPISHDNGGYVE